MSTRTPTPPDQWSELLRERGLRATEGRLAALAFIDAHPHNSAAAIHAALTGEQPSLSLQSVHNIVNDLTESGMLRRIDPPDSGSALYETRLHDNHHHLQCMICHRIEDVDCALGEAPCLAPSESHGMRIVEATITFRGVCADCDAADARRRSGEPLSLATARG